MFFTAPQRSASQSSATLTLEPGRKDSAPKRKRRITEENIKDVGQVHSYYPKRIPRACDRCRLKKTRCSGGKICSRCKNDGVVCVTTTSNPKKEDSGRSSEYVHLVESQRDQLVQALQKVLEGSNLTDQTRVRALLTDMGISMNHLPNPSVVEPDLIASANNEIELQTWHGIFDSLDTPQLTVIESLWSAETLSQRLDHMGDEPSSSQTQLRADSTFDHLSDESQISAGNARITDNEVEQWLWNPLLYDYIRSPDVNFTTTSTDRSV